MYKLKPNQPDFECVDGPYAGRRFKAGQTYLEIPQNESHKFDLAEAVETGFKPVSTITTEHTEDTESKRISPQRRRGTEEANRQ